MPVGREPCRRLAPVTCIGDDARQARRVRDSRVFLFFLLAAAVLSPGTTGSIDTTRRMQVARSLWTAEPEVLSSDDSGVPSAHGPRRAYYGIGQSLVLLPADVVSRLAEKMLPASERGRVRGGLAMLLGAVPVAGATGYLAFRLAVLHGLARRKAMAVSSSWFFGTTVLPQAQIWQEAGLLVVLMVCQLVALEEVARGAPGRRRYLWSIAGGCSGALCLLTKLPTLGFGALAVTLVYLRVPAGREGRRLAAVWLAGLTAGAFFDRLYHFARFGSWWGTYIHEWGAFARAQDQSLPESFPFSTPMLEGLAGMLFRPAFSIVLVEPLLLLVPLGLFLASRGRNPASTTLWLGVADLVMQALFYSRFYNWMGWDGWGNRLLAPCAVRADSMPGCPPVCDDSSLGRS
jgi:hypothetical protein